MRKRRSHPQPEVGLPDGYVPPSAALASRDDTREPCPFCERIAAGNYDEEPRRGCYVFPPLNPVTPGHLLVVPGEHVRDAAVAPATAAAVMQQAALIVQRSGEDANIITSCGAAATQTVPHLHVHVVPRREGDGLSLPWTGQQKENAQ
jgi:histidine triad (HIT) family protein